MPEILPFELRDVLHRVRSKFLWTFSSGKVVVILKRTQYKYTISLPFCRKCVPFMTNYQFFCKRCNPNGLESFNKKQASKLFPFYSCKINRLRGKTKTNGNKFIIFVGFPLQPSKKSVTPLWPI